ncbi:MAG: hypothetical protein DMG65_08315 [Candidatus Angelobacter sp. Gp1-AA117]|nr:MAG: hypothetical protein DMG65_08315 [Candidatus Angelobacter sp. Gp1-AA117]
MKKLTKTQRRQIQTIAAKKDEDINFSDIPEIVDWSGAEIGKFYRPPKKAVTIRLDMDIIDWLKADGPGYQTKVNWLLRHAMTDAIGKKTIQREMHPPPKTIRAKKKA